jgi:hypothetical protein
VVYELVMSWSQQAILLLLCGLLFYAALFYPGTSFRDHFAGIHRRRLRAGICSTASPRASSPDPDGVSLPPVASSSLCCCSLLVNG